MKHNDTAAVVDYKAQIDRMADFLKAAGYEVKHTHLMEAGARFMGARDWRTLRAELDAKQLAPKLAIPDLAGKSVRLYMSPHACSEYGESPMFCWVDIDQAWVNRMVELQALCIEKGLSEIEDEFSAPDWMDDFGTYRIQNDGVTVGRDVFWFQGYPKHASYHIETDAFDLARVIRWVQASTSCELFLLNDVSSVDSLMEELGRDEDDANFVTSTQVEDSLSLLNN